jgi:hypothetical protein
MNNSIDNRKDVLPERQAALESKVKELEVRCIPMKANCR